VRLSVQVQHQEQTLLLRHERRLEQGLTLGPERGLLQRQVRMLFPALLRRLLRMPEQRSPKGQALAQPSGGRLRSGSDRWISDQ
jgi:hypothetical protein